MNGLCVLYLQLKFVTVAEIASCSPLAISLSGAKAPAFQQDPYTSEWTFYFPPSLTDRHEHLSSSQFTRALCPFFSGLWVLPFPTTKSRPHRQGIQREEAWVAAITKNYTSLGPPVRTCTRQKQSRPVLLSYLSFSVTCSQFHPK